MPTGYTGDIVNGKEITKEDFILRCARQFGATISMRDEPFDTDIPVFEPSSHSLETLERRENDLRYYESMTLEEAEELVKEDYIYSMNRHYERVKEIGDTKHRLLTLLVEVTKWEPPTVDHVNLKEFAVEQLEMTIEQDGSTRYLTKPVRMDAQEWLDLQIKSTLEDIKYYTKSYNEELIRTQERNNWVSDLKNSLKLSKEKK